MKRPHLLFKHVTTRPLWGRTTLGPPPAPIPNHDGVVGARLSIPPALDSPRHEIRDPRPPKSHPISLRLFCCAGARAIFKKPEKPVQNGFELKQRVSWGKSASPNNLRYTLGLQHNKISDEGCKALARAIPDGCLRNVTLKIANNVKVTDVGKGVLKGRGFHIGK